MKNYRTPRTLADSIFVSGYRSVDRTPTSRRERIADVLLAVSIGVALAVALVAWWSA
jgi:hypothetical protein